MEGEGRRAIFFDSLHKGYTKVSSGVKGTGRSLRESSSAALKGIKKNLQSALTGTSAVVTAGFKKVSKLRADQLKQHKATTSDYENQADELDNEARIAFASFLTCTLLLLGSVSAVNIYQKANAVSKWWMGAAGICGVLVYLGSIMVVYHALWSINNKWKRLTRNRGYHQLEMTQFVKDFREDGSKTDGEAFDPRTESCLADIVLPDRAPFMQKWFRLTGVVSFSGLILLSIVGFFTIVDMLPKH